MTNKVERKWDWDNCGIVVGGRELTDYSQWVTKHMNTDKNFEEGDTMRVSSQIPWMELPTGSGRILEMRLLEKIYKAIQTHLSDLYRYCFLTNCKLKNHDMIISINIKKCSICGLSQFCYFILIS